MKSRLRARHVHAYAIDSPEPPKCSFNLSKGMCQVLDKRVYFQQKLTHTKPFTIIAVGFGTESFKVLAQIRLAIHKNLALICPLSRNMAVMFWWDRLRNSIHQLHNLFVNRLSLLRRFCLVHVWCWINVGLGGRLIANKADNYCELRKKSLGLSSIIEKNNNQMTGLAY